METEEHSPIVLKIGARELVAFMLRSGNLMARRQGAATSALEGLRGHQKLQNARPEGYVAEVAVQHIHDYGRFSLEIRGRIDGVFLNQDPVVIEEIKTTRLDFEDISSSSRSMALAQGRLYAWIFARTNNLERVAVRVTWMNIDNSKLSSNEEVYSFEELDVFFQELVAAWMIWAEALYNWREERDRSIRELAFPFDSYRAGQRPLAARVFRAIRNGQLLFAQAPTGIGKTLATLFPVIKAMGTGLGEKLFYLTARNTGAQLAEQALELMRDRGLKFKAVTLTARDKMCFNAPCDVETCEFAIGYYDRLRPAMMEAFSQDQLNRVQILDLASRYKICPFEFSLEMAQWCDAIIGDYNYAFDPNVYLRRFFGEGKHQHVLLIDEAHNLVDRAREMYSAELDRGLLLDCRKTVKTSHPQLARRLGSINRVMSARARSMDCEKRVESRLPQDLLPALHKFCGELERLLSADRRLDLPDHLIECYFQIWRFVRTAELYGDNYVTLERAGRKSYQVRLFCLNPSPLLGQFFDKCRAAVFFSATLMPFPYFTRLLVGNSKRTELLRLASPFPVENLCLTICPQISTRYQDRGASLEPIAAIIGEVIGARAGNYLVFFPSYQYLSQVLEKFRQAFPSVPVLVQESGMTQQQRDHFLASFDEESANCLGFAVMGGIFGEGIDLTGNRLIGVIVVGVGLPALSLERDLIRDHFQNRGEDGFAYAYQYPGLSRVLQTAGRVIRTEKDRGVVCLIGNRFVQSRYWQSFPPEWQPFIASDRAMLRKNLDQFWSVVPSGKG